MIGGCKAEQSAARDAATDDGATGDGATGDGATGDGPIGDGATGDGPTADAAPPDLMPPGPVLAVTHGMSLPPGHPRLWFTPARLAKARTWYATHTFNPPTSEDTAAGYGDVALHGLLTENATGSCDDAITWALSRLDDVMDTGGVACDPCRWTGEQLILVYDWCYDHMSSAERTTFRTAMNAGLSAWSMNDWGGPGMYMNNYYWGYLRNELEWAITSYEDNTAWAESMLDFVFTDRLADAFNPSTEPGGNSRGGVAYEGSEYGPVVAQYPLIPFTTVGLYGRDLYQETDYWREFVYALIYATTPAPTTIPGVTGTGYTVFPFSDDEAWNERFQAQTHYFPDFMTAIASYWPTANVGRHARQWASMVNIQPWRFVQSVDEPTTPLSFAALPLDFYASGPRYFYVRDAWGADATVLMLQLGDAAETTIGHQHGDYGTFQIWRDGRFVSRETVAYSGASSTDVVGYNGGANVDGALPIAHNTVLVNGLGPGGQYTGPEAIVERLESRPGYAYAAVDLVPPSTRLQQWRREFVFVRSLKALVILDRLETSATDATKTFINHCETNPTLTGNDRATCTVGTEALVMSTLLPSQRAYRVVDEGSGPSHQYRIEVDTTPGTAQSYLLNVLQSMDSSGTALSPTVNDTGSAFEVTLDGSTSITFQKGMTSTGGSITQSATTTDFRTSVQTMSVTLDGPVWAP